MPCSVRNLEKILSLTAKINSTLDLDELLSVIMKTAEEVMETEAASLLLLDEETRELVFRVALGTKGSELREKFRVKVGEGIAGWVAKTGEPLIVDDASKDPRFASRFDRDTGFATKKIICVPLKTKGKVIGVLEAFNPRNRECFSSDDLSLFEVFANQSAIAIENAKLHRVLLAQEVAQRDLAIAHEIQQNFLPNLKEIPLGIELTARNIPAQAIGGDFYDVIKLDGEKIGILIGDVAGKGVPAALYMVKTISDARFLAFQFPKPGEFLTELNRRLVKDASRGTFTTLLYLVIDTQNLLLSYASAGHHPVLKRSARGSPIESLKQPNGIPIGIFEKADYVEERAEFESGDVFVLYTDGIIEARNPAREEYGIERLKHALRRKVLSSENCSTHVEEDLKLFVQNAPQHDDMTLIVIRIP